MTGMQIVVFSLNKEICGVDTTQVKQIIKHQEVTKVPRMPKFLEGMINLRGAVVPVVNLNKRFEMGESELTKKSKILISVVNEKPVGFMVNDVLELLKLSEEDIEVLPELIKKAGNNYLKCVGKKGEQLISILDFSSILTDSEIKRLK